VVSLGEKFTFNTEVNRHSADKERRLT